MKKHSMFAAGLMVMLALLLVFSLTPTAFANGSPPEVVCVNALPLNPAVPHDTWSGLEISLKCTAHDPEGDGTMVTYEWDFGDGSPAASGWVTDPYVIEAWHTYTGSVGDLFIAVLTVTDLDGLSGSDQYLVEIKDGADLTVQVNVAIDEGLWRLHKDMDRGTFSDGTIMGILPYGWNSISATGAGTEAFEIHGSLPSGDLSQDPYVETVQRGLNYMLSELYSFPVTGDPDANGNGIGLRSHGHETYSSGISLMAISSSGCPGCIAAADEVNVLGRSYEDIAQDMVDGFAYCQTDPSQGVYRGGWRYDCNSGDSDNSVSQWPVIGMESAEVNFGSTVPLFVKDELNLWIDYIQNDVDGDWEDGGSGYTDPWDWVNIAKTGGLLAEMKFAGDTTTSTRVQDAVDFIDRKWDGDWEHFPNSYYAFYSVMKGFRLLGIETINPINDPTGFDWYGDPVRGYAQHIVGDQSSDGAWYGGSWSDHPLTSAWAILTLKKTVVQPGPVADAGPDVPSHPPVIDISFDGTGSYHRDPDRSIVTYEWDFGDGSPLQYGATLTHAFPAFYHPDGSIDWIATERDYIVTLTVIDDSDPTLSDSDTLVVQITPPPYPPVADANGPYVLYPCRTVILDGSASYDPNETLPPDHPWYGHLVSWEWDLDNDGAYDDATGEMVPWSSCTVGVYVVGLRVTNNWDETDEVDTVIVVVDLPRAVPVDIKPESCPNPFNFRNKGLIPVAVLGTEDLDVTWIDPASTYLQGVAPVRWAYEDVGTPYEPYVGKLERFDCTEAGADGYMDLVLFYEAQEVAAVIDYASDGDVLLLWVDTRLLDEFGGTILTGQDVVWIIRKGNS